MFPDLGPTRFAQVRWVRETDSTNARLLEEARAGAPEGLVLVADHQSAGRGRLGRTWVAPPGSALLVSVLLRPDVGLERAHLVTMAAGVAAVEAVTAVAPGVAPAPGLKWPNDVVAESPATGTRKLAGLLAESVVEGSSLRAVVVGMGLNVRWPDDAGLPAEVAASGTALDRLGAPAVDRAALLGAWLERLDRRLDALEAVPADYRRRCTTIGRAVAVHVAEGTVEGTAVDVTPAGHLVVDTTSGRRTFAVGDVVHLRPS